MCYALIFDDHHLNIDAADHTDSIERLYLTNIPVRTKTGNLLTHAEDSNTASSLRISMKRPASPAVHDDERPAKMGKMTDVSASGEPQRAGKESTGNDDVADAKEVDEASVVVAEDKSVLEGSGGDGGDGIERKGKGAESEARTATSGSMRTDVEGLKQQLLEQGEKLREADDKIELLKARGRKVREKFMEASSKVAETDIVLEELREESSELRAENVALQSQLGGQAATSKTKSGTAAASLKEQVKDVEKKANERWDKKLKKVNDDHATKIAKLKKDHKQLLNKKESAWSDKLDELKVKHEEQGDAMKRACDVKKAEWKATFLEKLNKARTEKNDAIESEKQAKKQFAENVKALKAEQQAEIKKYKPDTADAVKDLKAQLSVSNNKIERLKLAAAQHKDLAVKAIEGEREQKSRTAIATEMVEKARAEKDELMVELAARKQAYQDLAFHKQKVEEWKLRAEGHQRGVSSLNMALQSRDRALEKMRAELRAAFSENERLKEAEKRLAGELAGFLDEGCA